MARYYDKPYYKEPWYNSWRCMISRCYNEKNASYSYYGGNGVTVCDEWKTPIGFAEWADATYEIGCTLDRIDGAGNYEPSNCRWATKKEQANNRKSCTLITYNGETHNITEWSKITGINRSTLINRHIRGWDDEKILTAPITHGNQYTFKKAYEKGERYEWQIH